MNNKLRKKNLLSSNDSLEKMKHEITNELGIESNSRTIGNTIKKNIKMTHNQLNDYNKKNCL